ncbi:glycosyltransferase [bacterium]|nr:glycosyltransferase [bacterium]
MTDLSVVIVSYNVCDLLTTCLLSVHQARAGMEVEVFVVDNASQDDTLTVVRKRFPWVKLIDTGENLGFAKANNLALKQAQGRHLMILNPDTVVGEQSLKHLVDYLDSHPEVGAVGPKVLDPDGSFQATSKRGLPTPWASFCKLSGLAKLFPKTEAFNRYELGHLDPEMEHEVEVLYGAAMMVRREAYEKVGGLDESYFMYGEDVAWSDNIGKAGWRCVYLPGEPIVHVKGESTRRSDTDRDHHFYGAMRIFARKHFKLSFLSRTLIDLGVGLALVASRIRNRKKQVIPALVDLFLMWSAFWMVLPLSPEQPPLPTSVTALVFSLIGLAVFVQSGAYRKQAPRLLIFLLIAFATFALFTGFTYFFRSRILAPGVMALASGFAFAYLMGWRALLLLLRHREGLPKTLIVGDDEIALEWAKRARTGRFGRMMLIGLTGWDPDKIGEVLDGLPVLGPAKESAGWVRRWRVRKVVVSLTAAPIREIIQALEQHPLRNARVEMFDTSLLWDGEEVQPE